MFSREKIILFWFFGHVKPLFIDMDIIEHTFKNWLLLRLLGSSMDKQNWSLAFLFSIERYGFKAFECGLIARFRPTRFGNLQFTSATKISSWEAFPWCQILRIVLGLVDSLVAIWLMQPLLNFPFSLCLSNSSKIAWRSALLIIYLFIYLFGL